MLRDDDELYDLITDEINKKFTFKKICKDIDIETDNTDDFVTNQCVYMCNKNIGSIKKCKNNSIDNVDIKSRQIKKLKILKKTFVSDEELSVVTIASTKINDIENKVIIKDFYDEYEMMYELFIANILKSDPTIEQHICGYFGRKSDTNKLILEYIQGKTITEMTNLTMKDFSDIMSQIFLILNYAYDNYRFLHGDLHTENFLIVYDKDEQFNIELPLANGKYIKYKSKYKVVFIDFGLSYLKYKFHSESGATTVLMSPLEQEDLGFEYSNPLVDITKLLIFIMTDVIYENKHKKLSEVSIYITDFIRSLYAIIGKPNKKVNSNFIEKSRSEYGYIYDLIDSNMKLSFEDLYVKFVRGTRMDIHDIEKYLDKDKYSIEYLEDTEIVMKIIQNITNENIKLDDKIDKVKEFITELKDVKKMKFTTEQVRFICSNLYHYTCKYELNKNVFEDDNHMIYTVNKVYSKFVTNKIFNFLPDNEKYKVVSDVIEFKLNKFVDCFITDVDIYNVLNKYNKLTDICDEQIQEIQTQKINKILKSLLIKNYNKLPYKIFQKNFIDNEINVKKYNSVEQIKFLSNIVFQIKQQLSKLDIHNIKKDIKHKSKTKSIVHSLYMFFYNLYKYCEKYSLNIFEKSKYEFIDWISYNRIILYDYYIRHISLLNVPNKFIKVYLNIIELEDEIWEKFYKKDDFNTMSNSFTFSENMLNMIFSKDFSKLLNKLSKLKNPLIESIKDDIQSFDKIKLKDDVSNDILKTFKNMYKEF